MLDQQSLQGDVGLATVQAVHADDGTRTGGGKLGHFPQLIRITVVQQCIESDVAAGPVRNQLDAREYEDIYWGRWFYPLNVLALCLAAIPFAFGSLRSGGLGRQLFLGILFALGFWLLQLLFSRMAGAFKFDYWIAYLLPPLVMLGVSMWLFKRRSS